MSYSTINSHYDAPAQGSSTRLLTGATVAAAVGAVALTAVAVAPSSLYAATATRPVASTMATVPVSQRAAAQGVAGVRMASQRSVYEAEEQTFGQAQAAPSNSWAFILCASVAGAINGLLLFKSASKVAAASTTGRREALVAGAATAGLAAGPAFAAYGDAANVFGKAKPAEVMVEFSGDGWSVDIDGKFQPSKEREVPGMVARWEDSFDAVNNAYLIVKQNGSNSVKDLGSLAEVRNSLITPLLGQQVYNVQSISEGGFAQGKYSNAAVLEEKAIEKAGKTYYSYYILSRTADGNEGGRHQLYVVASSNGKTYIFKQQVGDKRWTRGMERPARQSIDSFVIA